MTRGTTRSLAYSLGLHGVLLGGMLVLARGAAARPAHAAIGLTEVSLELVDAPRPVVQRAPTPVVAPASQLAHTATAQHANRAARSIAPGAEAARDDAAPAESAPVVEPPASASVGTTDSTAPAMDGHAMLLSLSHDAYAAAVDGHAIALGTPGSGRPSRNLFGSESDRGATPYDRARAASQGYVAGMLAEGNHSLEPPGTSPYLRALRHRIESGWQPRDMREAEAPSMASTLFSSVATAQANAHQAMGPLGDGPGAAAVASLAAAHPNSDGVQDLGFLGAASAGGMTGGSTAATVAQVVLEQDALGAVLSLRVLVSSHRRGFDDAAIDAVRQALALETATAMPGGRRTVWLFRAESTAHAAAPTAGVRFDETRGQPSWMFSPDASHHRGRIQLLSSHPLQG